MQYLHFPNFKKEIFSIGGISFYWYGFMYFLSFLIVMLIIVNKSKKKNFFLKKEEIIDFLYYIFLGIIIGGRIGYVFIYEADFFIKNPKEIFFIWKGGMSFHGGLIGTIISLKIYSYRMKKKFFKISDLVSQLSPIGIFFGRIGNFINGELWGRVCTKFSWCMLFPNSRAQDQVFLRNNPEFIETFKKYGMLPRHPSQIYEMLLEGLLLYLILLFLSKKKFSSGIISSIFLFTYGIFRFLAEIFREPDENLGVFLNFLSMGQILSILMIFFGICIYIAINRKKNATIP
ncbi:prolipoprotein diacylglyceryl transferase [bacterium endosymbiont of Pedicinus badii]|uniref:prolipoprotein diacylglyceryl transferase n=1 Tax=bacterium endosymbiont of Pedicinus badii TaxID=1719126 RepID=UPI0009BA16E5|nr:prolipoprotein diacylglyceryl transferase [bacterium endosymbiont of Pedicinus badii]OQM34008.1 hypothetical protein AOQ89_01445 [bacterium endosymbiont of Pedicinus badii]